MKTIKFLTSLLFFSVFIYADYYFFMMEKFSGTEAIAFFMGVSVLSLIVLFFSDIQELSVSGMIVKLKNTKDEADNTIISLRKSQISTYRALLMLSREPDSFFASSEPVDSRYDRLVQFCAEIKDVDIFEELKPDVHDFSKMLLIWQLQAINNYTNVSSLLNRDTLPLPQDVEKEAVIVEKVEKKLATQINTSDTIDSFMKNVFKGLDCYSDAYQIYEETKPKSTS